MRLKILLAAGAVVAGLALPAGAGAALPSCRGDEAIELSFQRAVGASTGTLSWRTTGGPRAGTFRVFRDKTAVGETGGQSLGVEVRAGRTYTFTVRFVDPAGRMSGCGARIRADLAHSRAVPTRRAGGHRRPGGSVRLVWSPSKPGDRRVAGYRVYRDGRAYKRVRGLSLRVRLPADPQPTAWRPRTRAARRAAEQRRQGRKGSPSAAPRPRDCEAARVTIEGPRSRGRRARGEAGASPATGSTATACWCGRCEDCGSDRSLAPATSYR